MASHLLFIALVAIPAFASPISRQVTRSGISWSDCSAAPWLPTNLQCANLSVPVNWDAPEGDTFNLAMTVANIAGGLRNVSSELLNSFDLIGVDPRGVGLSAKSQCDPNIWNERVSQFPKTKEDYDRLVDKNKRLGESCLNRTGDVINHLDTISAVKDHEAVRAALGERLNWLGLSYGTQLGSQYAQLFPDNIRVMVLDGMLQHSQTESSNILIESTAYAAELVSFFKWASTNDSSPLKGEDVEKLWYSILKNATDTPIPAPDCDDTQCRKDVNEEEIRLNAQGFLLSPRTSSRTAFANALLQASEGDASRLSTPLASETDPSLFAGITIGCQDWSSYASSFEDFQAKMRIGEVFAPLNKGGLPVLDTASILCGMASTAEQPTGKAEGSDQGSYSNGQCYKRSEYELHLGSGDAGRGREQCLAY